MWGFPVTILWIAFAVIWIFDTSLLTTIFEWIQGLPLIFEIILWIVFLPWVFSLWIWQTSLPLWARILIIVAVALPPWAAPPGQKPALVPSGAARGLERGRMSSWCEEDHMSEPPQLDPQGLSEHAARNRESWNVDSDTYQEDHGPQLSGPGGPGWGVWHIPESGVEVWRGARPGHPGIGMRRCPMVYRFGQGRGATRGAGPLREPTRACPASDGRGGSGLPAGARQRRVGAAGRPVVRHHHVRLRSDDLCRSVSHGAGGGPIASPGRSVGLLQLYAHHRDVLPRRRRSSRRKSNGEYFGMWVLPWEGYIEYMLPYGAWIRLFRAHGFTIEDLIELRPKADAVSTFRDETDRDWYRRWPGEQIWKVRREG